MIKNHNLLILTLVFVAIILASLITSEEDDVVIPQKIVSCGSNLMSVDTVEAGDSCCDNDDQCSSWESCSTSYGCGDSHKSCQGSAPLPTAVPTSRPAPTDPPNPTDVPPGTTPDPTTPPCEDEPNCACGDSYNGSCWVCNSCDNPTDTPPTPTNTPTPTPTNTPTPTPFSTIKGYKVKMPGNRHTPPNSVSYESITLDAAIGTSTTANPFSFTPILPGQHNVTATLPAVNYSVGYTLCDNDELCHRSGIYTMGNSANVTSVGGRFSDLYFHYWEYISWVRLKRASFHAKTTGTWFNYIPPAVVAYDAPYDTNQVMLNIDELDSGTAKGAGLVTGEGVMDLGPNSAKFSNSNFAKQNYHVDAEGYLDNLTQFVEYAKAKKDVKIVANMDEIAVNRINIINHPIGVVDDNIPGGTDPIIVIVLGDVTIYPSGSGIFNSPRSGIRQPLVLMATGKITLDPAVKEVAAILIANEYDLGTSALPLKVIGNLISKTPVVTTVRQRPVAEYQQASVYVVFHPLFYEAALPYLSTIIQEGRQLQ